MYRAIRMLIIMGFFFVLQAVNTVASVTPALRLDITDPEIVVGQPFNIDAIVENVALTDEVLAFGFDAIYSSSFTFINAVMGDGFHDDSTMFPDFLVSGSAFPGIQDESEILLSTLSFTPFSLGTFSLVIYSDLYHPNQGLFTLDHPQVDITTSLSIDVVPVPPSLVLFGSALVGGLFIRKRMGRGN